MKLRLDQKVFLAKLAYIPNTSFITEQLYVMFGVYLSDIEYVYVERTDTEGFVFRLGDTCVISFSGTESLTDLWYDSVFIPSSYYDGFLHKGFRNIFWAIHDPVCNAVEKLFPGKPAKIIAIGHSLGASIAMGASDILYYSGYDSVAMEIITFGCPNGWSRGASKSFNDRHPGTTNYINPFDYVTWMLGVTTGRPGKDIKLSGRWGHRMDKYLLNVKKYAKNREPITDSLKQKI